MDSNSNAPNAIEDPSDPVLLVDWTKRSITLTDATQGVDFVPYTPELNVRHGGSAGNSLFGILYEEIEFDDDQSEAGLRCTICGVVLFYRYAPFVTHPNHVANRPQPPLAMLPAFSMLLHCHLTNCAVWQQWKLRVLRVKSAEGCHV